MKIDCKKLDLALARACKSAADLRSEFSSATLTRIRNDPNYEVTTKTAGRLARALAIDVRELIKED